MKGLLNNILKYKPIIFLDQLLFRVIEDRILAIGAQMSYFLVLSLFPFIIVLLNIISYTSLVKIDVLDGFIQYLPMDIQHIITSFVDDLVNSSSQELLSIAAFAGIWTASTGITPVIRAINKAYDYEESRSYFKLKFLSILFTIALLMLLIMVFTTLVFGELLGRNVFEFLGKGDQFLIIWTNIRFIIPIIFMVLTFALLYKYSPCVEKRRSMRLSRALPGGIFSTFGWILTSSIFSYYVSNFGKYSTTYGSVGGVIVLLVWLYISSIIIVFGGEINATLEHLNANNFLINHDISVISKFLKKV